MGSALNQRAVETYALQMYAELASLLERASHPLALEARSLADRVALPIMTGQRNSQRAL